jgi:o-succinylbenzoate---CoA ligase
VSPAGSVGEVVASLRAWLDGPDDVRLVVETSGSTGAPKRVLLSRAAVEASIAATERRLGAAGRWVLMLPPSYVAGVQVICRSLVAGHEPATEWLGEEGEVWFTSLVPTQLHRLLDSTDDIAALRTAHTILLGGGPIDAELRRRADDEGLRVVATYGSAETSGGCVYDGMPLDGVAVAIGTEGRIRIGGPTLFDGYEGDPELTAGALVDGWFLTSDAGSLDDDGRLTVFGRMDDMVISGGVNVPAPAVAATLRRHPDIAEVEVLGVDDPEWGQRVVAFVVTVLGVDLERLREWVAAEHPRAWAPRQVVVVDEIPRLDSGKPDRVALRSLA